MYKSLPPDIRKYTLGDELFGLHKQGALQSDFGMDSSSELLDGGFGLYSSADLKPKIGPIKSEYYRMGLFRRGSAVMNIGLERFQPMRNFLVFGFPGQIFSFENPTADLFNYYCLFNAGFVLQSPDLKNLVEHSPFYQYAGLQCFEVPESDGAAIEALFLMMNAEWKTKQAGTGQAVRALLQLALIAANRCYGASLYRPAAAHDSNMLLFNRFIKLVSQHVPRCRKVADYAELLHVTADHLSRIARLHAGKSANQLIDEMILLEARALLRHSALSVAEIAYQLEFTDPSHFNKFFKKGAGCTPLQYRNTSD